MRHNIHKTWDSRGVLSSRGGPTMYMVWHFILWHLAPHILGQLLVYSGNMSIISISVIQETIMHQYPMNIHVTVLWERSSHEFRWIYVAVIQEHEITMSSVTKYPCNDYTCTWNNNV